MTDYRFRGYSLSDGNPAATISLTYDHPSGVYIGGSAVGSVRDGQPDIVNAQVDIGYAIRIGPGASLDLGIVHSEYFTPAGSYQDFDYTELFLGAAIDSLSARISFSPNYYRGDTPTLYAEIEGGRELATNWFVSAHVGALVYVDEAPYDLPGSRFDWRVGLTRQFGKAGVHLDLSGRVQGANSERATDDTKVVLSLTRAF